MLGPSVRSMILGQKSFGKVAVLLGQKNGAIEIDG
jgi:hypothetical protein